MKKQLIIYSDLDGTLLDERYSFKRAMTALEAVRERNIPLVLCSSKTKAEIEMWRERLGNKDPFISENGGGIFIPDEYFGRQVLDNRFQEEGEYQVRALGASYSDLRRALKDLRSEGFSVQGFGDMNEQEIADVTGLPLADARLAKRRDFDEPFLFSGDEQQIMKLTDRIRAMGFRFTQGEFYHIMGNSDKGRAVDILNGIFQKKGGDIVTIGLGDSPNDIEMLNRVEYPVVVQKPDGRHHPRVVREVQGIFKADGVGPDGWNTSVCELLETLIV